MVKPRRDDVEYRNIRLKISTYRRLEKLLVQYIQQSGDPKLSLDAALGLVIDDMERAKELKVGIEAELRNVKKVLEDLKAKHKG